MARVWSISSALVPVCARVPSPFLRAFARRVPSLPPPSLTLNPIPNPSLLALHPGKCFPRNFSANAANESGVESPLIAGMEKKIKEQLKAEAAAVKDLSGDGRHVSIRVVSECFQGQSKVNRHRMVYKAISEELESAVHAVDYMETKTPAEASL